jgi:hypothetical protein
MFLRNVGELLPNYTACGFEVLTAATVFCDVRPAELCVLPRNMPRPLPLQLSQFIVQYIHRIHM